MNIFAFGLGYSATRFIALHGADHAIAGTVRSQAKADALTRDGLEALVFNESGADPVIEARIKAADALLISAAPGLVADPVLERYQMAIWTARNLTAIVYLSTVGVYGDHQGAWVDETSMLRPTSERSIARVKAERAWAAAAGACGAALHVLRLGGIYGPGQNAICNLRRGTARRIAKPGQVFNRIHVDDIAGAIKGALAYEGGGEAWNVVDDEPAPPQDVVAFAAALIGAPLPPLIPFETAELGPMARSFYGENKRCSNRKLVERMPLSLHFPTYREALRSLVDDSC